MFRFKGQLKVVQCGFKPCFLRFFNGPEYRTFADKVLLADVVGEPLRAQRAFDRFFLRRHRGGGDEAIGFNHDLERNLSAWRMPSDTVVSLGSCFTAHDASLSLYPSANRALRMSASCETAAAGSVTAAGFNFNDLISNAARTTIQAGAMLDLETLGMPAPMLARFRNILQSPSGIILVTGPTGSGKTTSLYAALNSLNKPEKKIITVEDPVEYRLPRISQVQVNSRINLDFSAVLRSALRQDPDIILVGEMRDQETAEIGLRAAMTGHLVLSTLHTNDAVGTADRLLDMGAPGYLLAASLRVIIAQRLVRRICESCGERHLPDANDQAWLAEMRPGADTAAVRRGRGCQHCNGTGFRGRVGVYEYLEPTLDMLNALRRGQHDGFVHAASRAPLFRPLAQAALDYALAGMTTLGEAKRVGGEISPSGAR